MNISALLTNTATTFGGHPAVFLGDACWLSYSALARQAGALARALRDDCGVGPGDRVALYAENGPDYITALWAGWIAGACVVPVNAKLHPRELAYILDRCRAKVLFASAQTGSGAAQAVRELEFPVRALELGGAEFRRCAARDPMAPLARGADDPAWLFYTSGTTGRPKGATLSHRNLLGATLRYYADVDFVDETDVMLHLAPLSHGSGLYSLPLIARGAAQVVPASGGFDPDEVFDLLRIHRKVTTFLAPTMVNRLVQHPRASEVQPGRWQTIFYGGAPMYVADIKRALARFGPVFWQGYGQGETPCTIASLTKRMHADAGHPDHEARLGSTGTVRTGVELRVVDPDGRPVPPGEVGEVAVRSDVTMLGYWQDPEATRAAIRDGWLHTGDLGSLSADGFLTLKDRSKDLIISGGSNIYPREVEEVLLLDDGVAEVSVIGVPDPEWGEAVVAFVVGRPGVAPDPARLDALCLDHIARFKRPKHYRVLPSLPKSAYGKILKSELRQSWQAGVESKS